MFKTQRANLKFHPITSRLVQFKQLLDRLSVLDQEMDPLIDKVLEAVAKKDAKKTKKMLKRLAAPAEKVKVEASEEEEPVKKKAKKKLKILDDPNAGKEDLTYDEKMAVDMFEATRRKGKKEDDSDDSESDEEQEETIQDDGQDQVENQEEEEEEEGKRGITYQIAKNKGLQPKRNKLQRNPRVKHRHKFEKAKKRRKGQVREVKKELKKYSGEHSGINARVKKGIKIMWCILYYSSNIYNPTHPVLAVSVCQS